ncbi:MAG: methyltransferase domain-containing protein [Chloroflexota bacterium]|nr:methyltransferase domain-containing protein [Chloroflexota bacterium]
MTTSQNSVTKDDQALKIFSWAAGAASLRMAGYGLKLGLFSAIAASDAGLTLAELNECSGLDPRYLRAWAKTALAGELLEYDSATERFSLAPFIDALLLDDEDFQYSAGLVTNHAVESRMADRVEACFATGAGIPFVDYGQEMVETIHAFSKAAYELFLPTVLLPELPELTQRLSTGGTILELGCGAGAGLVSLARTFPLCTVTGLDSDPTSVGLARERIETAGLSERVHSEEMRGEELTSEQAFDLIYVQISLHEMDDARVVLANAQRALKDGGTLLVTEIRGPARIEDCRGAYNAVLSHLDLFYEVPQALAKGGHAVGFFSRGEIEEMALEAGLSDVRELELQQPLYAAFAATKK